MFNYGKLVFEFGSFVDWTFYALHAIGTEFVELLLNSSQDLSLLCTEPMLLLHSK
jgi:hypothetical protein